MRARFTQAFSLGEQYDLTDQHFSDAVSKVMTEHKKAVTKYPQWPISVFAALTVLAEENGEAEKATLDFIQGREGATFSNIVVEHAQAAAMHIRQIQHLLELGDDL